MRNFASEIPVFVSPMTRRHSSTMPAHIDSKLVWTRPGYNLFLKVLSKFATISIWSSVKVASTRTIAHYLFRNVTPPRTVHSQEHCKRIVTFVVNRVPKYLKVEGTEKDVFLKTLSVGLFPMYRHVFTIENTIVVDDSAYKHVLNNPNNVLLADTWSPKGEGASDSFLLDVLLPWLRQLHNSVKLGLHTFRLQNQLGHRLLCASDDSVEYIKLTRAIELFNELVTR